MQNLIHSLASQTHNNHALRNETIQIVQYIRTEAQDDFNSMENSLSQLISNRTITTLNAITDTYIHTTLANVANLKASLANITSILQKSHGMNIYHNICQEMHIHELENQLGKMLSCCETKDSTTDNSSEKSINHKDRHSLYETHLNLLDQLDNIDIYKSIGLIILSYLTKYTTNTSHSENKVKDHAKEMNTMTLNHELAKGIRREYMR